MRLNNMTPDQAWDQIEFNSQYICKYIVGKHRWGCGTLEGCDEGDRCDVLDHMAELQQGIDEARLVVGR